MGKMKTLRDWMPREFEQAYMDTRTAEFLDCELVEEIGPDHRMYNSIPQSIQRKHVYNWCTIFENGKYYAVAWNENPSRGWSFPICRFYP